jgi:hypothetical protein
MLAEYRESTLRKLLILNLLILSTFLVSCGSSNPLIGSWEVVPGQKSARFFPCKIITFEKSLSSCAGLAEKVSYEIRKESVIVHGELGISAIYKIISNDQISVEIPYSGRIIFRRVKS